MFRALKVLVIMTIASFALRFLCDVSMINNTFKRITVMKRTKEQKEEPHQFLYTYLHDKGICDKYPTNCSRLFHSQKQSKVTKIQFQQIPYEYNISNTSTPLRMYYQSQGRLGNAMFQYASSLMIARYLGRELVIRKRLVKYLANFKLYSHNIHIQKYVDGDFGDFYFPNVHMSFRDKFYKIESNFDINIKYCFQSYKFFQHAADEISLLYEFTGEIKEQAFINLKKTLTNANCTVCTVVGVHVRRGDQIEFSTLAPPKYYKVAMDYFRQRYQNVFFVVSSREQKWCKENLEGNDWALGPESQEAAVDMSMLTMCDHIITSEGTYSFWTGWLSKGTVLYHNITYHWENHLPHWIPIGPYFEDEE